MTNKTARLILEGKDPVELPIYTPTLGNDVIDINQLSSLDVYTFDPGFVSTASCESKITYIDGDNGILLYRGYPIEQLAEKKDFIEVAYLLLNGELPNDVQTREFNGLLNNHSMVHQQMYQFKWFSSRCASDGHHGWYCRRIICILPRLDEHEQRR